MSGSMGPGTRYPERIAILGAGRMGCGIAHVFCEAGHEVKLYDASPSTLAAARKTLTDIGDLLECDGTVQDRLQCTDTLAEAVGGADLVIEAVTERLQVKQDLFRQVEALAPAGALLATNTSAIPIAQIGRALSSTAEKRLLGMHFWNPPHLVALVEVVQSALTEPRQIDRAMTLLRSVGMSPVHVRRDIPGFIGNRLQHALKREAIALVAAGVCDASTLDEVVRTGFGSRLSVLGPLEQSDMVGLDLTLAIHEVLIADLDRTPGPHPWLRAKVAAGETGMATGVGFRAWSPEESAVVKSRLDQHLLKDARRRRSERESGNKG